LGTADKGGAFCVSALPYLKQQVGQDIRSIALEKDENSIQQGLSKIDSVSIGRRPALHSKHSLLALLDVTDFKTGGGGGVDS